MRYLNAVLTLLLLSTLLEGALLLFFRKALFSARWRFWVAAALLLAALPCSAALFLELALTRVHVPLRDLFTVVTCLLASLALLAAAPAVYVVATSRRVQNRRVEEIRASLQAEITQREKAEEQLRALSLTDELTGLYNRRGLITMGEHQLKLARRNRRRFLLLYADLDNMKHINDRFGHLEGDAALIEAAEILRQVFRESDIIARIGGDEFVILALEADKTFSQALINRIHQRCILANLKKARPYVLAMSAGAAEYNPEQPASLEELVAVADRAMYTQKQGRQQRLSAKKSAVRRPGTDIAYGSDKAVY